MTHIAKLGPVWTLVNGRHLVDSNIHTIEHKSLFVSHAINSKGLYKDTRQAYRMHRLNGSDAKKAAIIRESMISAKITMLEEILHCAIHPEYLGNPCYSFDYATPINQAIAAIRRYPSAITPTTYPLS